MQKAMHKRLWRLISITEQIPDDTMVRVVEYFFTFGHNNVIGLTVRTLTLFNINSTLIMH